MFTNCTKNCATSFNKEYFISTFVFLLFHLKDRVALLTDVFTTKLIKLWYKLIILFIFFQKQFFYIQINLLFTFLKRWKWNNIKLIMTWFTQDLFSPLPPPDVNTNIQENFVYSSLLKLPLKMHTWMKWLNLNFRRKLQQRLSPGGWCTSLSSLYIWNSKYCKYKLL